MSKYLLCSVHLLNNMLILQDILRLLFGKDVKDVDVDMIVKKRNEFMADRGKKVHNIYSTCQKHIPKTV